MQSSITRRRFLQAGGTVGAGAWLTSRGASARSTLPEEGRPAMSGGNRSRSPGERLNIGIIGVSNRGAENLAGVGGENIAALCDVDDRYLREAGERYPKAYRTNDFRRLIDRRDLDAVVISTPDHTHAVAAVAALDAGLHVYCEKPLAHTVAEARAIAETASRRKRVTQMGTQIHAGENYRRVVELVRGGAIGPVREVHVWLAGGVSGGDRPVNQPSPPGTLHYDLWLGPAPWRPYHPAYLPGSWRAWWDFGNGMLGDFGCHYMDLPFWALDLRHPVSVESDGPPVHAETTPAWQVVRYRFPERGALPPVDLTWHHGGRRPEIAREGDLAGWANAVLFVGEKGMLVADYGARRLLPAERFEDFTPPPRSIPDSIGHHAEWIEACKSGEPTTCGFDYAGPLTEAVLLGNVAYRAGCRIEWDAARLRATGCPDAVSVLIRKRYRRGWRL